MRAAGWATAGAALFADTLTKILGRLALPAEGVALFPGVILRVFDNLRGPFGLGSLPLTIVASTVVLVAVIRQFRVPGSRSSVPAASVGLLLGGGVSNLVERLLFGRTTDLLIIGDVTALNVADAAILGGLALLLWPQSRRRRTVVV